MFGSSYTDFNNFKFSLLHLSNQSVYILLSGSAFFSFISYSSSYLPGLCVKTVHSVLCMNIDIRTTRRYCCFRSWTLVWLGTRTRNDWLRRDSLVPSTGNHAELDALQQNRLVASKEAPILFNLKE